MTQAVKKPKGNKAWMKGFVINPAKTEIELVEQERTVNAIHTRRTGKRAPR